MRFTKSLLASFVAIPLSFIATSAQAAPVTGMANIAGSVNVSSTTINFDSRFTNTPGAMETGDFAGLTGGTIMSLTGGPVTGNTNVPGFIRFTDGLANPITFDLTYIAPGAGTAAGCSGTIGTPCTPAGSPFTLVQLTSNTVLLGLQLNGVTYTGSSTTGTSGTVGVFSTQTVMPGTIGEIFRTLGSGGTISGVTYSATFNASPVPEPASMLLMGMGLVSAGIVARRKAVKK